MIRMLQLCGKQPTRTKLVRIERLAAAAAFRAWQVGVLARRVPLGTGQDPNSKSANEGADVHYEQSIREPD